MSNAPPRNSEADERDATWEAGYTAALRGLLARCVADLGVEDVDAGKARWLVERTDVVLLLRGMCEEYGDNEWPDNLHLSDVIDKHLMRHVLKGK